MSRDIRFNVELSREGVVIMVKRSRRSVRSLWKELCDSGAVVSYENFLRWIREIQDEAVEKGILLVGKGKRKTSYVIKDSEALVKLLYEKGYVF